MALNSQGTCMNPFLTVLEIVICSFTLCIVLICVSSLFAFSEPDCSVSLYVCVRVYKFLAFSTVSRNGYSKNRLAKVFGFLKHLVRAELKVSKSRDLHCLSVRVASQRCLPLADSCVDFVHFISSSLFSCWRSRM